MFEFQRVVVSAEAWDHESRASTSLGAVSACLQVLAPSLSVEVVFESLLASDPYSEVLAVEVACGWVSASAQRLHLQAPAVDAPGPVKGSPHNQQPSGLGHGWDRSTRLIGPH